MSTCRHYYSWVLVMLLGQQGIIIHTAPLVAFKITEFTSYGYSCMPDKVPVDRRLTFPVASNLYRDSEELLRNLHLAPYLKPMVSLIDDFPTHQRHKGWQFGYLVNDTSKQARSPQQPSHCWIYIVSSICQGPHIPQSRQRACLHCHLKQMLSAKTKAAGICALLIFLA